MTNNDKPSANKPQNTIGSKIRKFRELRGLTQKELGLKCGFSESTAYVRIAQYENGKVIPKEDVLKNISKSLGLQEDAILGINMENKNIIYHFLFELEDSLGLCPERNGNEYYLKIDAPSYSTDENSNYEFRWFLEKWYECRNKYLPNSTDTEIESKNKHKEYALWRGEFPSNLSTDLEKEKERIQLESLQAQVDELYVKTNSEKELEELHKISQMYQDDELIIECEYHFIQYIIKMLEAGIKIKDTLIGAKPDAENGYDSFLYIKLDDIHIHACRFKEFEDAVKELQKSNIDIKMYLTSLNRVLYVTYKVPQNQMHYFSTIKKKWSELVKLIEEKKQTTNRDFINHLEYQIEQCISDAKNNKYKEEDIFGGLL